MKDKKKALLPIILLSTVLVICTAILIVNSLTADFLSFGKYILLAVSIASAVGIVCFAFRLVRECKKAKESVPAARSDDTRAKKRSGLFDKSRNDGGELIYKYEQLRIQLEEKIIALQDSLEEAIEKQEAILKKMEKLDPLSSSTDEEYVNYKREYDLLSDIILDLRNKIRQCEDRLHQINAIIDMTKVSMASMEIHVDPKKLEQSEQKMSQVFISYKSPSQHDRSDIYASIMRNISESRELWGSDDVQYRVSEGGGVPFPNSARMRDHDAFCEPADPPKIRDVEFSALSPKTVEKGDFTTVEIVAYEGDYRYVVDKLIENADSETRETVDSPRRIADNTMIKVVLSSPHIEIEDEEITQEWVGRYLVFRFNLEIPEDFDRKKIKLVARVYFNDVIATNLSFSINCEGENSETLDVIRKDVSSAFMSYASEDRAEVVSVIQGMKKVRPDLHIFFDVDSLRSGEDWKKCIMEEIEKSDVLYLCWSQHASESIYVEAEWKYALSLRGVDSIEPIPLVPPSKCPPPKELDSKHFNDRMLYYRM